MVMEAENKQKNIFTGTEKDAKRKECRADDDDDESQSIVLPMWLFGREICEIHFAQIKACIRSTFQDLSIQ